MGKYLLQATYTQAGLVGLLKEGGTSRRAALASTIEERGRQPGIALLRVRRPRPLHHRRPPRRRNGNGHLAEHRRRRCPQRGRHRTPDAGDRGRSDQEERPLPRPRSLIGRSQSGC